MALHSSKNTRERLLVIGGAGTGKSHFWLSIAARAQKTGSTARFFAIDTDASIDRMLDEEFPELTNVEWRPAFEWTDYTEALNLYAEKAGPEDFIIIDMISPAWDSVQEYFVQQLFGKSSDEFFMEARKAQKKGNALDGFKDWTVINRLYRTWMNRLIFRTNANIICTAGVEQVGELDDKTIRVTFGPYGVKPRGQKHLPHSFHTVLLLQCRKPREDHSMTTIKDRGRDALVAAPLKDASLDYLLKVAKWKF